jgi:hypothetical protein
MRDFLVFAKTIYIANQKLKQHLVEAILEFKDRESIEKILMGI